MTSSEPGRATDRPSERGEHLKSRRHDRRLYFTTTRAVAAFILTAIYHMLKDGTEYQDLGAAHFDKRPKQSQAKRLLARLRNLGYTVQVEAVHA